MIFSRSAPFAALLTLYFVLAFAYSTATPIFEAPDENYHVAVSQFIARTGGLPVQDPSVETPYFQEGSQPPLYYLLAAPIFRLVPGVADVLYPLPKNPHARIGIGLATLNRNAFLHSPAESFPWSGVPLAVHLTRFLSVLLGGWTVFCTFRIARRVLPDSPWVSLIAVSFVALNPMFLFISGSANNDTLVTALSATAVWLIIEWVIGSKSRLLIPILSIVLALSALSKLSGLTLYALTVGVMVLMLLRGRISLRGAAGVVILLGIGFAVLAGWWYVRNAQLYGDLTGLNRMIQIIAPRQTPYTFQTMLSEMQGLRISSWALFGWLNLIGPGWLFDLMDLATWLALIGGLVWFTEQIRARNWARLDGFGVLGAQIVIISLSLVNFTRLTPATQGRLLFPALPAFALFAALGWVTLARLITAGRLMLLAALPLAPLSGVALVAPFAIIAPAYRPPPTVAALPPDATASSARFEQIEVVGFRAEPTIIQSGQTIPVTIYFRGQPDPRNLSLFLTAYDCQQQVIGKIDSYPGGGNLATSIWQPGLIYADHYDLPIGDQLETPCQPTIELGFWDYATKTYLNRTDSVTGNQNRVIWQQGAIIRPGAPTPAPQVAQSALFSGALALTGYSLNTDSALPGGALELKLIWQAKTRVYEDFTVFVHLEGADGKPITDADSPPRGGHYPTSVWSPGMTFEDPHTLRIPTTAAPGPYRITIGLYRPKDLSRLPLEGGGDTLTLNTLIEVK